MVSFVEPRFRILTKNHLYETTVVILIHGGVLPAAAQVSVSSLKVNHMCEPSGVVDAQPVLSWIVESPDRNVMQQAYEVRVFRDGRSVWRTGRVESQNSVTVAYEGEPLASGTRYEWQVRVWDNRGRVSKWSERSSWLTGMMTPDEWQAEWILPARADRCLAHAAQGVHAVEARGFGRCLHHLARHVRGGHQRRQGW